MKKASLVVLLLLCASLTAVSILPERASANTLYVGGAGSGNYSRIQAAIDSAEPWDTVYVFNGTYHEALMIEKPLSLVGEDRENTTIVQPKLDYTQTSGTVIEVNADAVSISGFTVEQTPRMGWWVGIKLHNVRDCTISDSIITDSSHGIYLWKSSLNSVLNTDFVRNFEDIYVVASSRNTISGNTISGFEAGVSLYSSHDNMVNQNLIQGSHYFGIYVYESTDNSILKNVIRSNHWGILISHGSNNTVAENSISKNTKGMALYSSGFNSIFHNNFKGNMDQATDDNSSNAWDDGYPSGGNYWDDCTGIDIHGGPDQNEPGADGIVDFPRHINGGQGIDRYPFMSSYPLTTPSAPRDFEARLRDDGVLLLWNPPATDGGFSVTNYIIYRGTSPGEEEFFVELGDVLSYTDRSMTRGQAYYYEVSAKNQLGEGPKSYEVNATLYNPPPMCYFYSPGQYQYVSMTTLIEIFAYDFDGWVSSVEIRIDEEPWIPAEYESGSWTYDWDTTEYPDGNITIYARAYDGMDYSDMANVTVIIGNALPPHIDDDPFLFLLFPVVAIIIAIALAIWYFDRKHALEK